MSEIRVDPDLWAVFKAVMHRKDDLQEENEALRRRIVELEEQARLVPFWRRRAKHALKLLAGTKGCNCALAGDGACSKCYTGPVTTLTS